MKVALFCEAFPIRSQTFVRRQARDLIEAGVDLRILTFSKGEPWTDAEEERLLRGRITVLRPRSPWGAAALPASLARTVLGMSRAAGRREPDALRSIAKGWLMGGLGRHDAILAHFGPVGVRVQHLREAGLVSGPLAVVFHGYDLSIRSVLERHRRGYASLLSRADLLLPVSERWRARLIEFGAEPSRVRVHRMGVDVVPAVDVDFSQPLSVPLRVLSVGRFVAKKGFGDAIDAVEAMRLPAELTILGDGELDAALRARAAGGGSRVRFGGSGSHADVLQAIARADVLLQPSLTAADGDTEGIPVVLMEAMSRGTLVLSTRHGGIGELVEHGRSGLLVDEQRPDQIASTLDALAAGAHDVERLRRAAHDTVAREFKATTQAGRLLDLLKGMAAARSNALA